MRVIFLYICIVIGLLFRAIPDGYSRTIPYFRIMYPFDRVATECYPSRVKGEVSYSYRAEVKDWFYYLSDHVVVLCVGLLLYFESSKYRNIYKVFAWLQVANIIDYMVTFNTGWVMIGGVIVTFNMIFCVILSMAIVNEYGGINH